MGPEFLLTKRVTKYGGPFCRRNRAMVSGESAPAARPQVEIVLTHVISPEGPGLGGMI
jgi:hypothetical protein